MRLKQKIQMDKDLLPIKNEKKKQDFQVFES